MTNHPNRSRLTADQRALLQRAHNGDVMVLQSADTFEKLERRGLARMEQRDLGLREPVFCIALTDKGREAIEARQGKEPV